MITGSSRAFRADLFQPHLSLRFTQRRHQQRNERDSGVVIGAPACPAQVHPDGHGDRLAHHQTFVTRVYFFGVVSEAIMALRR
jgi:hypothetical protein